ncbi:DUF6387 family protein [Paraburkholderia sediminicola]|uniref:DUF6387 family protein n=1 Tax=Paraburkholderia sediminicola TaxID=458836 RepID=UPI0038BDFE91
MIKQSAVNGIQLPSEFDINKYAGCENFSLSDWARNISGRVWLRRAWEMFQRSAGRKHADDEDARNRDISEERDYLRDEWLKVMSSPLSMHEGESLDTLSTSSRTDDRRAVRDMDVCDYMIIRRDDWLSEGEAPRMAAFDDAFERWWHIESSESDDAALAAPYWRARFDTDDGRNIVTSHGKLHASVNLHASEEKLAKDFIRWVRETKKALGMQHTNKFTAADMKQWHRNRILAYFDLVNWADLGELNLDDGRVGRIIFPEDYHDGPDPAPRVRRSVRTLLDMFTPAMSSALIDQALQEQQRHIFSQKTRRRKSSAKQ